MTIHEAHALGYNAYMAGATENDNPFNPISESDNYDAWMRGHATAEEEDDMIE